MSRLGKFVVVVSVIWFILSTAYGTHRRSGLLELLSLPVTIFFLLAIFISVIILFTEWRMRRWHSLLPLVACVLSIVLSGFAVCTIRHAIFIESLPSYEAVVQKMETGAIPVTAEFKSLSQAVPQASLTYAIFARRDVKNGLMVDFLTESGFPVKHSGYLFTASGTIEPGSLEDSRWPIRDEEKPHWFFVSD